MSETYPTIQPNLGQPDSELPQVVDIPRQLLESWISRESTDYVDVRFTKRDVDKLFFSIVKAFNSIEETQNCVVAWSNGETQRANESLQRSKKMMIEGQNEIRQLLIAIMAANMQAK